MFAIPIDAVTFEDVNNFCQTLTREGLVLDYKLDFPKRLEKTIASFANTYGGHILIGVDETATGEPVLPIVGVPLQTGLRERVVAIALDAINPPVNPEVRVCEFASPGATINDRAVIVVRVHESHEGAHAVDGGTSVYLRVDNISDQSTRKASIEEIGWLIDKRQKSIAFKEQLIRTAESRSKHYEVTWRSARQLSTDEPKGTFELWTVPKFPRTEILSPRQLLKISRSDWKQRIGNIEFPYGSASPIADGIRHPDSLTRGYWYTEVNRFGLIYTKMGFPPGAQADGIDCKILAQFLVAGLKFSVNVYNVLGYFGLVDFHFTVGPTRNRYPYFWEGTGFTDRRCLDGSVTVGFSDTVGNIRDSLIDRAKESYREFLWAFGMNVNEEAASDNFRAFQIED
jgi:schlafen family protein